MKRQQPVNRSTPINSNTLDREVVVSLKYLIDFWRSLNSPLINCEIEIDLSWLKDCILLSEIFSTPEIDANPASKSPSAHATETQTTSPLFQISSTKLYVPVVTLTINDNIKFLENLK